MAWRSWTPTPWRFLFATVALGRMAAVSSAVLRVDRLRAAVGLIGGYLLGLNYTPANAQLLQLAPLRDGWRRDRLQERLRPAVCAVAWVCCCSSSSNVDAPPPNRSVFLPEPA